MGVFVDVLLSSVHLFKIKKTNAYTEGKININKSIITGILVELFNLKKYVFIFRGCVSLCVCERGRRLKRKTLDLHFYCSLLKQS